ncbi:MAG: flagellar FliJ family protein [Gammaproteobacteria bacterium]|nr:flagellar FliJ family protein [Gammaproteobacteria bacterium]
MNRSKRLAAVQGLEDKKVEGIARDLAVARKNLALRRQQLEKLVLYMNEYNSAAPDAAENRGLFLERRAFLGRLDEALEAAKERVVQCERDCAALVAQWHKQKGRARALESAGERLQATAQQRLDKAEQANSDEVGARQGSSWSQD